MADSARERSSTRYEILGHIAEGGMAEIQLARSVGIEGFEKLVVIKRILPRLASDRGFVSMFLDEARLAATLQHSNIVQVYDIGSLDGDYFFAMEYLHGEDVRQIVQAAAKQGREVPLEHAISIVLGICAALDYAHNVVGHDGLPRGIIHRDVSPQNVIVTYDGGVKLVDFGIAKAMHRLTETREGTLKGKLQYMSPEQCTQDVLDPRSDVFAVAIMLWELTTGRQLYTGRSEFEILKSVVEKDARSPSLERPGYPARLEQIVMKGLRRDRQERYQSAQALQADLEEFARDERLAISPLGLKRFMRDLFGDRIDALHTARLKGDQAMVRQVIEAIDLRTEELKLSSPGTEDRRPRTRAAAPRRATARPLVAAVVGGVALLGLAVTRYAHRQGDPTPRQAVVEPSASVLPPPKIVVPPQPHAAIAQKIVTIRRSPANARLTLDDVAIDGEEVAFDGSGGHVLRVDARGYIAEMHRLDGRSPSLLVVALRRRPVERLVHPEARRVEAPPVEKKKPTATPLDP